MPSYLHSPALHPHGFYFTEDNAAPVRNQVARWMKQGAIVEITLRGPDETVLVNFGRLSAVIIGSGSGDDVASGRPEVIHFVDGLHAMRAL